MPIDGARSLQSAHRHEHSPSAATPKHMGGRRRLLDELDGDCGESLTAIAAGGSGEGFLINDMSMRVFQELQGILFELHEEATKLRTVHDETKHMQSQVTKYVEQRLHEHKELLENSTTHEVRTQLCHATRHLLPDVPLQKQGDPFPDALPSTSLVSQAQNIETLSRMKSCSSLPGTLAELPPTNTVDSEQHEEHFKRDLLMQQTMEIDTWAIEQLLEAAVAEAELAEAELAEDELAEDGLAAPSLLDLPRCETKDAAGLSTQSSRNASTLRTCSLSSSQRRTSSAQQQRQLQQKVFQSHLGVRGRAVSKESRYQPILAADKASPRGQRPQKIFGTQSLADILEYRRQTCEGPAPPSEVVHGAGTEAEPAASVVAVPEATETAPMVAAAKIES